MKSVHSLHLSWKKGPCRAACRQPYRFAFRRLGLSLSRSEGETQQTQQPQEIVDVGSRADAALNARRSALDPTYKSDATNPMRTELGNQAVFYGYPPTSPPFPGLGRLRMN